MPTVSRGGECCPPAALRMPPVSPSKGSEGAMLSRRLSVSVGRAPTTQSKACPAVCQAGNTVQTPLPGARLAGWSDGTPSRELRGPRGGLCLLRHLCSLLPMGLGRQNPLVASQAGHLRQEVRAAGLRRGDKGGRPRGTETVRCEASAVGALCHTPDRRRAEDS